MVANNSAPYYSDGRVTLYHGDCVDLVDWLAADVLITDPPYGSEGPSGYGRSALGKRTIANDRDTTVRDRALAMWGDRPALVFGHPSLPEPPGSWDYRLVWDKRTPGLGAGPWRWQHEMIFVRGKWRKSSPDFSVMSISRGPQSESREKHPHAKPDALMRRLIDGAPGTLIADPFAGGGSTLVAAKALGLHAIGVEEKEAYCEEIAKRLDQGVLDFGEVPA